MLPSKHAYADMPPLQSTAHWSTCQPSRSTASRICPYLRKAQSVGSGLSEQDLAGDCLGSGKMWCHVEAERCVEDGVCQAWRGGGLGQGSRKVPGDHLWCR